MLAGARTRARRECRRHEWHLRQYAGRAKDKREQVGGQPVPPRIAWIPLIGNKPVGELQARLVLNTKKESMEMRYRATCETFPQACVAP